MSRSVLAEGDGVRVIVARYRAGERHPLHRDRYSRITLVLGGGFREETPRAVAAMRAGDALIKSRDALHEDEFGDAAVLAVEFVADESSAAHGFSADWAPCSAGRRTRGLGSILDAAATRHARGVALAARDFLASGEGQCRRTTPPSWIAHLKAQVEESGVVAVDVAAASRAAGAHPSHASRLFRRCYGATITETAMAASIRRALDQLLLHNASLADAALAAGFYDQSHMNRAFRRHAGATPGVWRRLQEARAVKIVQDRRG